MKYLNLFLLAGLISCSVKTHLTIQKVVIYKHFRRAGSTAEVSSTFYYKYVDEIDTNKHPISELINKTKFADILNRAKASKHYPRKIGGIALGGEFYDHTNKHYFIICSPQYVVDMSSKINYAIENTDDQKFIQNTITQFEKN